MKLSEKNILGIIILSAALILSVGCIFHIKAVAETSYFTRDTDTSESEYREELKDVLKAYGAKNAGITMTKTCEDGHTLNYKVVINLPDYINTENEKGEALIKALEAVELSVEDAYVTFSFS